MYKEDKNIKLGHNPSLNNKDQFEEFIISKDHPCIMAQTIFNSKNYFLNSYSNFGSETAALKILEDLEKYLKIYDFSSNDCF